MSKTDESEGQQPDDIARVKAMLPIQKRAFKVANGPKQFDRELVIQGVLEWKHKSGYGIRTPSGMFVAIEPFLMGLDGHYIKLRIEDIKEVKDVET